MTTSTFPPPPSPLAPAPVVRRLERDPDGKIGGVAGGVAAYLGVDVSVMRLIFVVAALTTGVALPAYLVAWLIVPEAARPPIQDQPAPPAPPAPAMAAESVETPSEA